MAYKVVVLRQASQQIGRCGLSRAATLRLLTGLYSDLPHAYPSFRANRDPDDRDRFLLTIVLNDGGMRHRCVFRVNDTLATDHLFVESVRHDAGPIT